MKSIVVLMLVVMLCHGQYIPLFDYTYPSLYRSWYARTWYYVPYADTNYMYYYQPPTFSRPAMVATPSTIGLNNLNTQSTSTRNSAVQAILDRANGITTTPSTTNTGGLTNLNTNPIRTNVQVVSSPEQQQVTNTLSLVDSILSSARL